MKKGLMILIGIAAVAIAAAAIIYFTHTDGDEVYPLGSGAVGIVRVPGVSHDKGSGTVVYTSEDFDLEISESAEMPEGVKGTTKDGNAFVSTGDSVYVTIGEKVVKAAVTKNTGAKDAGKIAGVVSSLISRSAYIKGQDDYNHTASVYYIEVADCLLYYPAQFSVMENFEDNSLTLRDPRSGAVLRVTLDTNPYTAMDELEGFIKNSEYNRVLAMGNDWYTAENAAKNSVVFTYAGLGDDYIVEATLTYANRDAFVFDELRTLIKCRFIGDGVWVSEARDGAYTSALLADRYAGGSAGEVKTASYYSQADGCYLYYPEVFSVITPSTSEGTYFSDPATGAYILLYSYYDASETSLAEMIADSPYDEREIDGAYSVRFKDADYYAGEHFVRAAAYRDGTRYYADLFYPSEYDAIYASLTDQLRLVLPGEEVSTTEMQTLLYPDYKCAVTIPAQFYETENTGSHIVFADAFNGLEMTLDFTELMNASDSGNLFDLFDCRAADADITLGEDTLRWQDRDGLRLGAAGALYGALLYLPYPNALVAYFESFDRFAIDFVNEAALETQADQIRAAIAKKSDPPEMDDTKTQTDSDNPAETRETEYVTTPSATTSDSTPPADTTTSDPDDGKSYSYHNLPVEELGEPSASDRIAGDINVLVFDQISAEAVDLLGQIIDKLIALDFTLTDSYEDDDYGIYRYDLQGYLPHTGDYLFMTLDLKDNGEGWEVVLTYVFRSSVGMVEPGELIWNDDALESNSVWNSVPPTLVRSGMRELKAALAGAGADSEAYVYALSYAEVDADELDGYYEDTDRVSLPVFSYGRYVDGLFSAEGSYVYEFVSGNLYELLSDGRLAR